MPRRKPKSTAERLTTLLHLVKLGAGVSFAKISTKRLGESIDLSQQAASLRLIELQKAGLVSRAHSGRGLAVKLTPEGIRAVESFLSEASEGLAKGRRRVTLRGYVFSGLGEGRYYISLKGYSRHFLAALGFTPFPGTLNLRLTDEAMVEQRKSLDTLRGVEVPGFRDGKRTYGPVKCFRAAVAGRYDGAVLAIERTHYDSSVLEVISPLNLRRTLKLKDGDECPITIYLEDRPSGGASS